jgi:hypothetical protein
VDAALDAVSDDDAAAGGVDLADEPAGYARL